MPSCSVQDLQKSMRPAEFEITSLYIRTPSLVVAS